MDFPSSHFRFKNGDSRLPSAQKETADCCKLTEEEKESLSQEVLIEDVEDPDILLKTNSAEPTDQAAGNLQNEMRIEEVSNGGGSSALILNAADLLNESAAEYEEFANNKFLEEEKKPVNEEKLPEDLKVPHSPLDVSFIGSIAPIFEDLQNEVGIEDDGSPRGKMLNAADLLDSDEDEPFEGTQKKKKKHGLLPGRLLFACLLKNCPSSYKTFEKLEEHLKIHSGEQDFFCDVCQTNFSSKEAAIAHIHLREMKECCECGRKISTASAFLKHLRSHSGEKPFVCVACGARFALSSTLNKHMVTHTGQKPFSCSHCDQRFAFKTNLEAHGRKHTGEKPFKCDLCDFVSSYRSNIVAHSRLHSGEKPYSCGQCEKRFSHSQHLRNHELTHTGEKPFECKDCGRKFSRKHHLNAHIRLHSGQKPYSCEKCDKKFTQKGNWKGHMKRIHHL